MGRSLEDARRLLEAAKESRAVDLHPHAREHQIPIRDIERVLAHGRLHEAKTPPGQDERYAIDLRFGDGRQLRLILILDEAPAFCRILAAYERW